MNPLEARTHAIETLMYLAEKSEKDRIRLDACALLLEATDLSQLFDPEFSIFDIEDEDE